MTLHIIKDADHDEEIIDRILRFWSGEPLGVSDFEIDNERTWGWLISSLNPLQPVNWLFRPLLLSPGCCGPQGLKGWVLLIDELELIGRYGRMSRGRTYVELARWLGALNDEQRQGLLTVGAITSDFEREVLVDKGDLDGMALSMEGRNIDISAVEKGMQLIRQAELMSAPDEALLKKDLPGAQTSP